MIVVAILAADCAFVAAFSRGHPEGLAIWSANALNAVIF
jgi:hypothetical protein